jgi:hypothetical protein
VIDCMVEKDNENVAGCVEDIKGPRRQATVGIYLKRDRDGENIREKKIWVRRILEKRRNGDEERRGNGNGNGI